MIVVDSSVWISRLRNHDTPETRKFDEIEDYKHILLGDIVLMEILQGAQNDGHATNLRRRLEKFNLVPLLSSDLALKAAQNFRILRSHGRAVKTADLIIGSYCIEHGHSLLQKDKDYLPMAEYLGLRLA